MWNKAKFTNILHIRSTYYQSWTAQSLWFAIFAEESKLRDNLDLELKVWLSTLRLARRNGKTRKVLSHQNKEGPALELHLASIN